MTAQFGQVSKTGVRINPVINFIGTSWIGSQQIHYFCSAIIIQRGPIATCCRCFEISVYFLVKQHTSWKITKTLLVFLFICKIEIKNIVWHLFSCGLAAISCHPVMVTERMIHSAFGYFRVSLLSVVLLRGKTESLKTILTQSRNPFWDLKKHHQNINLTLCTVDVSRLYN